MIRTWSRFLIVLGVAAAVIAVPASARRAETPRPATIVAAPRASAAQTAVDAGFVVVGSRNSAGFGLVRTFADNDLNGTYETLVDEFVPYSRTVGDGVRVATGDLDGDRNDELITASSEGAPVKVYELSSGGVHGALADSVAGFTQGSYVAAGDLNGDGRDELIVGSDPGAEPKVKIFADTNADGALEQTPVNAFNAYPASFTGGVRVAVGNTDGALSQVLTLDEELVTAPGPGGTGQPIKIWDDTDGDLAVSDNPLDDSFLPYDPGFGGGTYVAAAEILAGVSDQVVFSPGGGQNRDVVVRIDSDRDGKVSDDPPLEQLPPPYGPTFSSGVRVAAGDAHRLTLFDEEVITAPGASSGSKPIEVYDDDSDPGSQLFDNPPVDQFTGFSGNFGEFVAFASEFNDVYSSDAPLAIPDNGQPGDPLTSVIHVPSSAGIIRDVDVSLNISHTFDQDLTVRLEHDSSVNGISLLLFQHVGHDDHGFIITLRNLAARDITDVPDDPKDSPVAGDFEPEGALSSLSGRDASGTWTLTVDDESGGDVGTLHEWSLKIDF